MKWLVCINDEGTQCQILAGKSTEDLEKGAKEQKNLVRYAKIKFAFEFEGGGHDPNGDK